MITYTPPTPNPPNTQTQGVLRLQVPPRIHRLPLDGEERLLHALQRAAPGHGRRRLLRLPGTITRGRVEKGGGKGGIGFSLRTGGWVVD